MAERNKANELYITRLYNAPVQAVWDAWTDPEQVAKWWGPRGFTLTTHSKELKPGGTWVYTMHGPDGVDYPNITTYFEVKKYSRLVYDHGASVGRPPLFRVAVDFSETEGKTKMEMTMTLESPEKAAEIRKFIKQAGGNATWDRLAEFLEIKTSGQEAFVINRSFNVPIEVMFRVWTEPEHFSKWLAPTGFNMNFIRADIKPGGSTFYCMSNDVGVKMYGCAKYIEVVKPTRIKYTQWFCDEHENVTRHPAAPTWPEKMLTIVTFFQESSTETRVTVEWRVHGEATSEEMNTFIQSKGGMTMGWTGSFDKLEDYFELSSLQ